MSKTIKDYLFFKKILSIKHKASLSTIYIGSTPSILNPGQRFDKCFRENYGIDYGAEITMEVDPASFTKEDLNAFIEAGINRFSLGAQSFNNEVLQQAGRRHLEEDVERSCLWLKESYEYGYIKSWSLDLIQNLPRITLKEWRNVLKKALIFSPPHISVYDLSIEDGTVFKKLFELDKLSLPNSEESFRNSLLTNSLLKGSGYSRYEISNYSLPGHQSRHNRVYWSGSGWWSFGQGSTSSPGGEKFTRPRISNDYKKWVINQCEINLEPSLVNQNHFYQELDEKIMLGLRLKEGVDIYKLIDEQNWDKYNSRKNLKKLLKEWQRYLESDLILRNGNRFFLSDPRGMELSNQILISMFRWWEKIN